MNPRQEDESGFVIVAVLWMVVALAVLALIYTRYAVTTAVATSVHEDRLRAEGAISAALELTAYQLTAMAKEARPSTGAFSFRLGRASITTEFRSEAARIDLNEAPKDLLAGLFTTLGAQPADADYYADRIIGWRKKGEVAGQNEEASAYRVAGVSYKPRQAPFQNLGELWLVFGIPPILKEKALPFLTVYSGKAEVDAENAAPEVVASQPGMNPDRLQDVLSRRAGAPQNGQASPNAATAEPKALRISVGIRFDSGRRVRAEAVILLLEDADEPYRVLSWRDDFDGSS